MAHGERGLWASQALASLNQKFPDMVAEVLRDNVKLLNTLNHDRTPLTKIAGYIKVDKVSDPEACFKLLGDMINTKGVNLNIKTKWDSYTIYSSVLDGASYKHSEVPASIPYFRQLAVNLESKNALDGNSKRRNNFMYDTSWRATYDPIKDAPQSSKPEPLPLMPVLIVSPPAKPESPLVSREIHQLAKKNLIKINETLKQSGWQLESNNPTAKSYNVSNPKSNDSFKIYPDKLTTQSSSVDTYVAMLKAFQATHPNQMPKINVNNKAAEANARLACNEVYKEKAASIQVRFEAPSSTKKQENTQASERQAEPNHEAPRFKR